jgi:hypothetical protein
MLKTNKSLLALLALYLTANLYAQETTASADTNQEATEQAVSDVPANAIPKLITAAPEQPGTEPVAEQKPSEPAKPTEAAPTAEPAKPAEPETTPAAEPTKSTEQAKPETAPAVPVTEPMQPEATQAAPTVEPKAAEAMKPAETPETGKKSQTFEESFGLTPSTPVETKPLHLPEIARLENTKKESDSAKATTDMEPKAPEAVTKAAASDEETCTTICKKVCLALKEEDRKKLEEEAPTAPAENSKAEEGK